MPWRCRAVKTRQANLIVFLVAVAAGGLAASPASAAESVLAVPSGEPWSVSGGEEIAAPPSRAEIEQLVDEAVAARLRSMPRPRYIPATDLTPPLGAVLIETDAKRGEFPFSAALSGYIQLRWFEFARSATSWTDNAGRTLPVTNINTFNLNRFFLSTAGHVVDERLLYNITIFGTSDSGLRNPVVPIGFGGWK